MRNSITIYLMIGLLASVIGCCKKSTPQEPYYQPEIVQVALNREHMTNSKASEIRMNMYDTEYLDSDPLVRFVQNATSMLKVPHGIYSIAAISDDSQSVMIRNYGDHRKIEAYMKNITRDELALGHITSKAASAKYITHNGQMTIGQPDWLYVANLYDIVIRSNVTNNIYLSPENYVISLELEVNVKHLVYASRCRGMLSGVCASVVIHNRNTQSAQAATTFYDARIDVKSESIITKVNCFGLKNSSPNIMYIDFLLKDGTTKSYNLDITNMITPEMRKNGGRIHITNADIELPKVEISDGDFGGELEDWGDEDIVELPM